MVQNQTEAVRLLKRAAEFRDRLDLLNAGELFVRAIELRDTGNVEFARLAQRSLMSRFPDSSMAGQAAQQLASLPAAKK